MSVKEEITEDYALLMDYKNGDESRKSVVLGFIMDKYRPLTISVINLFGFKWDDADDLYNHAFMVMKKMLDYLDISKIHSKDKFAFSMLYRMRLKV